MSILKSPIAVGSLTLKNRLVFPPMATEKAGEGGSVPEALCQYYAEKTRGGYIGLVFTEHSYVSPEGKASPGQVSISRDEDVDGLRRLVEAIHRNGTPVFAQINHAGGAVKKEVTGYESIGPSAVRLPGRRDTGVAPREMTQADIDRVVGDFAAAAARAKAAGYDGVEIHSAHGYLLNQFYSPLSNRRQDRYGGDTLESRIRLHLEVIRAVREAVGDDYPLALRLGASDYMPGGSTADDGVAACRAFAAAGIDLLDISGGFCMYNNPKGPGSDEQGYFSELTEPIKRAVGVPVILTGGVVDAAAAEALLAGEKADLIGVGRAIARDSGWAERAMSSLA